MRARLEFGRRTRESRGELRSSMEGDDLDRVKQHLAPCTLYLRHAHHAREEGRGGGRRGRANSTMCPPTFERRGAVVD